MNFCVEPLSDSSDLYIVLSSPALPYPSILSTRHGNMYPGSRCVIFKPANLHSYAEPLSLWSYQILCFAMFPEQSTQDISKKTDILSPVSTFSRVVIGFMMADEINKSCKHFTQSTEATEQVSNF